MAQQQVEAKSDDAKAESVQSLGITVNRTVKLAAETLVAPGSSLILDGQVVSGGIHLLGGLAARALLGPVGWFLFAADSYTKSVTGSNLYQLGTAKAH